MRYPAYLDTTLADPIARVQLPWQADYYVVINPTRFTIAIRIGSGSRPSLTDADMLCAPVSAIALPTDVREFFFLATLPALATAPEGMPARVSLLFTRQETPPAFSSVSLSGSAPGAILLRNQVSRGIGVYDDTITLPSYVRTVLFLPTQNGDMQALRIFGVTTGMDYINPAYFPNQYGLYYNGYPPRWSFPVDPALDTQLVVSFLAYSGFENAYILLGFTERLPQGAFQRDGRQPVDPFRPGESALPVVLAPASPVADVSGNAIAPVANRVLCTTGGLAAGDYMVEYDGSCTDAAAVGKYINIAATVAPGRNAIIPAGQIFRGTWSRVTLADATSIVAQVGGVAGAAGSLWAASIRAYKLA